MKPGMKKWIGMAFSLTLILALAGCGSPEDKKQAFLEKGNKLFEQKEFVKAKLEFKNAIQIDQKFARAYVMLGKTELEMKNFQQAFGLLNKAVELEPKDVEARMLLGRLLIAGRAPDRAMEQADAILAENKDHVEAGLLKASAYFKKKEYDRAEKILLHHYNSGVTLPKLYAMLSAGASARKDTAKARFYLDQGLEKNPDNVTLLLGLAQFEVKEKNYAGVEKLLHKVIRLQPENIPFQLNLAKLYLSQNKKDKAETVLNKILTAHEGDEKTRLSIATLWAAAKEVDRAETVVKQGIEKSPDSFDYRLFLAELYARTRRLDDSEAILRKALELNPDPANPDIIRSKTALAKVLLARAKVTEGEKMVDQIIKDDPKNVDAHFLKGRLFLSRKEGGNAVTEFRLVTEDRPGRVEGYLNLAQAHAVNKEYDLALDVLEKAFLKMPGAEALPRAMASINIVQKDFESAETNLRAAVSANPKDLGSLVNLGDFYLSLKEYDKALGQYNIVRDRKPDNALGWLKAAAVYSMKKEFKMARQELEKGYAKNPESAMIMAGLADVYIKQKQVDKAFALCNDRLEKNDKEAFTWNLLGGLYLVKKDFTRATSAFEKAVEISPEWGKPYDNLARIFLAQGEKQAAISKFSAALEKNPKNRAAWMILGSIYEKDRDYDRAGKLYKEAFEKNPGLWPAANNFAFIRAESAKSEKDLQVAMEFAVKAEKLNPGAGVVLDTLGWLHYKLGNLDLAYDQIKKALDQYPNHDMINYHMGVVLDKQGKTDQAKLYLEKSLSSDKDFLGADQAKKLLAQYKH